jgi:carbamoyltransferase
MTKPLQQALGCDQETPGRVDNARLENFREHLRAAGYTEERISKRLRVRHPATIQLPSYPIYQERLQQRPDSLSILISLFMLQNEVQPEAANAALTASVIDELLTVGVLRQASSGAVAANVSVYPCSGSYFITDHRFQPPWPNTYAAPAQPVMHLGQDSYALAYLSPKPPKGGRVLDLCTGSGLHAILATRRAKYVVGVDINSRAVNFARFNAALNGVGTKVDFRCGNLYDPLGQVAGDDNRFDLILANPPFIPSSNNGADRLLFQDAGPAGDEILAPILKGLLIHMKPRGMALIISLFVDTKRARAETSIRRWIGSRVPVDLSLIDFYSIDPEEFASWGSTWLLFEDNFAAYNQRYKERLAMLRSQGILRLTHGILVVRMSKASRFLTTRFTVPRRPQQNAIKRALKLLPEL